MSKRVNVLLAAAFAGLLTSTVAAAPAALPAHAAAPAPAPLVAPAYCDVTYRIINQWPGVFQASVTMQNFSAAAWNTWQLRFDFADGQRVSRAFGARVSQFGPTVTALNLPGSAPVPPRGTARFELFASYRGANTVPAVFSVNGNRCGAPARVPNPYAGAAGYVNPDWSARVNQTAAETGGPLGAQMAAVAGQPTAVWLNRIADLTAGRGLRGHLDAALAQQQTAGVPVVVTLVLHNVPNRDCDRPGILGELHAVGTGMATYRTEFVDPIAATLADPRYAALRIAAVIEPHALRLMSYESDRTLRCVEARATGAYTEGIRYALTKLRGIGNVYTYLDIGNSGVQGWPSTVTRMLDLITSIAGTAPGGLSSVDGLVSNAAGYVPTTEPFIRPGQTVGGTPIYLSRFYDFNQMYDEATYVAAIRGGLVARGFPAGLGVVIDTSRNGWGGPARPRVASASLDVSRYVEESAVDRRPRRDWWCNQAGAGLGALPQPDPAPSIHAYAWIKPPGESDGWFPAVPREDPPVDPQCRAGGFWPLDQASTWPTNALPDAPPYGEWFPAQFGELVRNAFPPIPA
jgi:cellulase/cellobiase CelA1